MGPGAPDLPRDDAEGGDSAGPGARAVPELRPVAREAHRGGAHAGRVGAHGEAIRAGRGRRATGRRGRRHVLPRRGGRGRRQRRGGGGEGGRRGRARRAEGGRGILRGGAGDHRRDRRVLRLRRHDAGGEPSVPRGFLRRDGPAEERGAQRDGDGGRERAAGVPLPQPRGLRLVARVASGYHDAREEPRGRRAAHDRTLRPDPLAPRDGDDRERRRQDGRDARGARRRRVQRRDVRRRARGRERERERERGGRAIAIATTRRRLVPRSELVRPRGSSGRGRERERSARGPRWAPGRFAPSR